ncbi:sensor histidine kinase [Actinomycetes bacterium KLBMP 9797]
MSFDHPALLYRDAGEYLAGTLPFIQAGLAAGEPVLVAVPDDNLRLIRAGLGVRADDVRLRDMSVAGRNPGRILPGVLLAFAAAHPGQSVRIIGEPVWAGRTDVEYPACAQHEALINAAFAHRRGSILCPYDVGRLAPEWVDDAYRTHPVMETPAGRETSPHYGDPAVVAARFNRPLPDPPSRATTIAVNERALAAIREFTAGYAAAAGLDEQRTDDLTLAVNELTTNTVEHGGGVGTLTLWTEVGTLVAQVRDRGHLADPLAGRVSPAPDALGGGRGLVLVNQVCDLVRVFTTPTNTTIRVQMIL